MTRFTNDFNKEIQDMVEIHDYHSLEHLINQVSKSYKYQCKVLTYGKFKPYSHSSILSISSKKYSKSFIIYLNYENIVFFSIQLKNYDPKRKKRSNIKLFFFTIL